MKAASHHLFERIKALAKAIKSTRPKPEDVERTRKALADFGISAQEAIENVRKNASALGRGRLVKNAATGEVSRVDLTALVKVFACPFCGKVMVMDGGNVSAWSHVAVVRARRIILAHQLESGCVAGITPFDSFEGV